MSRCYYIDIQLATPANISLIKKILTNGLDTSCTYYHLYANEMQNKKNYKSEVQLNLDQAATFIFETLQKQTYPPNINDLIPGVETKFSNTEFALFFGSEENGHCKLHMSLSSGDTWKIDDENGFSTADFARYLKVMAELCKGCVIEGIKIGII